VYLFLFKYDRPKKHSWTFLKKKWYKIFFAFWWHAKGRGSKRMVVGAENDTTLAFVCGKSDWELGFSLLIILFLNIIFCFLLNNVIYKLLFKCSRKNKHSLHVWVVELHGRETKLEQREKLFVCFQWWRFNASVMTLWMKKKKKQVHKSESIWQRSLN
jgi:hypothetical protein